MNKNRNIVPIEPKHKENFTKEEVMKVPLNGPNQVTVMPDNEKLKAIQEINDTDPKKIRTRTVLTPWDVQNLIAEQKLYELGCYDETCSVGALKMELAISVGGRGRNDSVKIITGDQEYGTQQAMNFWQRMWTPAPK